MFAALFAATLLMSQAEASAADFSSAEKALQALETAYFHEDLEAAVAARDFAYEAGEVVRADKGTTHPDPALIKRTAEVLELSFRKRMKLEGFPDFQGRACHVVDKKSLRADLVEMVEDCYLQNGEKVREIVNAAKTESGWRVVVMPSRQP
jgi:hypothetical protein